MNHYDMVLANMPVNEFDRAPLAPYLLKSVIEQNGFTCKVYDLNREIHEKYVPKSSGNLIPEEYYKTYVNELPPVYKKWLDEIKNYDIRWIGLSLVTLDSLMPTLLLIGMIKEQLPDVKIVLGGSAFTIHIFKDYYDFYMYIESLRSSIDAYVFGDGEEAIVELLKGNMEFPGINLTLRNNHLFKEFTSAPPVNINNLPSPDYSDIETPYEEYLAYTSRGCYNKCRFCIESQTVKYRYRNHKNIIADMDAAPFGAKNFIFADNSMNGNPKEFKALISGLLEREYSWKGLYICNNWMTDDDFRLASESGLNEICIGLESGCEKTRTDMNKPFDTESIIKTVRLCAKHNIEITLFNIIGWITETDQDFKENIEFVKTLFGYGNIRAFYATLLFLYKHQPIYDEYDFHYDKNLNWVYKNNTIESRIEKLNIMMEVCKEYNIETLHMT